MWYATLIKYALWAALILAYFSSIWWGISTVYNNIYQDGYRDAQAIADKKEMERQEEMDRVLAQAKEDARIERERQIDKLTEAYNEQQRKMEDSNRIIDDLKSKRMYVSAKQARCDNSAKAGEAESASGTNQGSAGTDRVELSEPLAAAIRDDYIRANKLAIACETFMDLMDGSYEVVN